MHKIAKNTLIFSMMLALIFVSFATPVLSQELDTPEAEGDTAAKMIFDLLILRPVGIAATVIGSTVFVISLPFSYPGGNVEPVYEKMIREPAKYTFERPLGKY